MFKIWPDRLGATFQDYGLEQNELKMEIQTRLGGRLEILLVFNIGQMESQTIGMTARVCHFDCFYYVKYDIFKQTILIEN